MLITPKRFCVSSFCKLYVILHNCSRYIYNIINLKASRSLNQKLNSSSISGKVKYLEIFRSYCFFLDVIWESIPCSTFVPNHTPKARLVCFLRKFNVSSKLSCSPKTFKVNRELKQTDAVAERRRSTSKFLFRRTQGQVNSVDP